MINLFGSNGQKRFFIFLIYFFQVKMGITGYELETLLADHTASYFIVNIFSITQQYRNYISSQYDFEKTV